MNKRFTAAAMMVLFALALSGCMPGSNSSEGETWQQSAGNPEIPEKLIKEQSAGMPSLTVYDVTDKSLSEMDIETYVMGVVAGEMKNDWPVEALKAQAILARTFVLKFCQDKDSRYEGADISTDVTEAQAYAPDDVNDRIRDAVNATSGMVMSAGSEYPYAWFHAHSGGMTELPSVALDFKDGDPDYLKPVESDESDKAPKDAAKWSATFKTSEVRQACADAGLKVDTIDSIAIGDKGASGRARTLVVNGDSVSAPSFRIQIGANKLKSTLIDSITLSNDEVTFKGRGFGHGVGMSQWGAYAMAEDGKSAEEIIGHYFSNVDIVKLW